MTPQLRRWIRYFVDYSAPVAFALVYFLGGRNFMTATGAIVVASILAVLVGLVVERRLAPMPLFVGLMGAVFGGLTLLFDDPRILKVKPTVVNALLGAILLGGLAMKKAPLKLLLGEALTLPETAWRTLTLRFGLFYLALALVNEAIWRTQSEATWVAFKSFGLTLLTIAFALTQAPLLMRHMKTEELPPPPPPTD
jgi:intracellular septation protein